MDEITLFTHLGSRKDIRWKAGPPRERHFFYLIYKSMRENSLYEETFRKLSQNSTKKNIFERKKTKFKHILLLKSYSRELNDTTRQ